MLTLPSFANALQVIATVAVQEWPVDICKIPVIGYSLPFGPQPAVTASLLPFGDFNVTRAGSASYGLPSNLLSQAAPGMTGFMWYARVDGTAAQLPSWLSIDPFSGTMSAVSATYEGTSSETMLTQACCTLNYWQCLSHLYSYNGMP